MKQAIFMLVVCAVSVSSAWFPLSKPTPNNNNNNNNPNVFKNPIINAYLKNASRELVLSMVEEINTNVGYVIKGAISDIESEGSLSEEQLPDFILQLRIDIQKSIKNIGRTTFNIIKEVIKGIGNNLNNINQIVQDASAGLSGVLVSKLQNIIMGLADRVLSVGGSGSALKALLDTILKLSTKVDVTSTQVAFSTLAQLSRYFMESLADGIPVVSNAVEIFTKAVDIMSKRLSGVKYIVGV